MTQIAEKGISVAHKMNVELVKNAYPKENLDTLFKSDELDQRTKQDLLTYFVNATNSDWEIVDFKKFSSYFDLKNIVLDGYENFITCELDKYDGEIKFYPNYAYIETQIINEEYDRIEQLIPGIAIKKVFFADITKKAIQQFQKKADELTGIFKEQNLEFDIVSEQFEELKAILTHYKS